MSGWTDPEERPLTWRRPVWLWAGFAWLLAGPFDLAVILAIAMGAPPMGAVLFAGLPCTILATLGAWRLSRRPVTHRRLIVAVFTAAVAGPFLVYAAMVIHGIAFEPIALSGLIIALAQSFVSFLLVLPFILLFALPISGIVVTAVRYIAFRRVAA